MNLNASPHCRCHIANVSYYDQTKNYFFRMLRTKGGSTTGLWSHLEHIHPDVALDQDLTRDNATSNPFAI